MSDLLRPRDERALSEAEAQRLGRWLADEIGDGPGAEALAAQRLRLASTARLVSPATSMRTRLWAAGGGVLAAAAVVGAVVLVGKWRTQSALSASRHPGISAEPLKLARDRDTSSNDGTLEPQANDARPSDARQAPPFTWRVSKTTLGRASSTAVRDSEAIRAEQRLDASAEPVLIELADAKRQAVGRVEFGVGARIEIQRVDAAALEVELEQGTANAVVSPSAAQLIVQAGPYSVRPMVDERSAPAAAGRDAEAAAYGVQWAPRAGALRVDVSRGEVEIVVPNSAERHVVSAGNTLDLVVDDASKGRTARNDVRRESGERSKLAHAGVTQEAVAPSVLPTPESKDLVAKSAEPNVPAAPVVVDSSQWRKLAENGQYAAAVKEAERIGFGTLEQSGSASDLLLLADVARLGGAPQRARSVLTSLRSRYPGHTNAAVAAFTLGRMAQEQEHDDRRAIQWYKTYLKEEPRGRMAEGARARLLKATLRVGSAAERDQAARDYLANHPTGSSAAVARSVLSK